MTERPTTDWNVFRLHGQSLGVYGQERDIDRVRDVVLGYALEDGWKTEVSGPWEFRRGLRAATKEVESRLRQSETPELHTGADRKLFYLGALGGLKTGVMEHLARVMRLTPYSGVAVAFEARSPFVVLRGSRGVSATYEFPTGGDSYLRWRPGIIGEGYTDLPAAEA